MNKLTISNIIKGLGISANLKGYRYMVYGIELMTKDTELMDSTMLLYEIIAKAFNTSARQAERSIRQAIEKGWKRADADLVKKVFGSSVSANKLKPTNSEFLVTVADYVLMKGGDEE